ncbi:MAG TPA: hypothetical protein GXZ40_01570 [Bacteroidales bacterium]|jgi:uncharacterized protein (TIGR02145 family)|nr:hypothetical protein [Bacteroidales bacterium]
MHFKEIVRNIFFFFFLFLFSLKGFAQSGFLSIGSQMGDFFDPQQEYVTFTYGQVFAAHLENNGAATAGVQQPYIIYTIIMDTVCQEADSTMHYQHHNFDMPLHTAGDFFTDNYYPISSYHRYDTVAELYLTIHPIYFVTDTLLVYDSQLPYAYNDSTILYSEGDHTIILPTIHGCDSTVGVMVYVATCPTDTHLVAGYSISDIPNFPLQHPQVVPYPIAMQNNEPLRYIVGDTTPVLWTLSIADKVLYCTQNVIVAFPPCGDGFYAYDGNNIRYNTVRVGCDCWTKENSAATLYTDGTSIPETHVYWAAMYPDTSLNLAIYGRLYDWYSALRLPVGYDGAISDTIQGLCPDGWHIPTAEQYRNLTAYPVDELKSPNYWIVPGNNATDFTSLPGGYYNPISNNFYNLRGNAYYWTSAVGNNDRAETFHLSYSCETGLMELIPKDYGYSVRCIKN